MCALIYFRFVRFSNGGKFDVEQLLECKWCNLFICVYYDMYQSLNGNK